MDLILITIVSLILIYFLYKEAMKWEIRENSVYQMFEFIFPPVRKYPKVTYLLVSALVFGIFFYNYEVSIYSLGTYLVLMIVQMVVLIDIRTFRLPNKYVVTLMPFTLALGIYEFGWKAALVAFFVSFFITLILAVIRVGGLGVGDVKLITMVAPLLGWNFFYGILIMFVVGGIISFIFLVNKVVSRKTIIPYGPFLFVGFIFALVINAI